MVFKRLRGLRVTFHAVAEDWLCERQIRVKPATLANYRTLLRVHLLPQFGDRAVGRIGQKRVTSYLEQLAAGALSASTRRSIQLVLQMVLQFACDKGLCAMPEFPPMPASDAAQTAALSNAEFFHLQDNLRSAIDPCRMGILLCMYTGLRIGEVCALRWSDIDLAAGTVTVSRTLQRVSEESGIRILIDSPKSKHGVRTIPLPRWLTAVMTDFAGPPEAYLLTGQARFMEPRNLQRKFQSVLAQAGLRPVKFHTLRHTFATRCASLVDPKALSYLMGHGDVSTTMKLYVHPETEQMRRCLERLSA